MWWFILPTLYTILLFYKTDQVHHYFDVLALSWMTKVFIGDNMFVPSVVWLIINHLSIRSN